MTSSVLSPSDTDDRGESLDRRQGVGYPIVAASGRGNIELNIATWLLAFLPIASLIGMLLAMRWPARRAAIVSWLIAVLVAFICFQADWTVLGIASAKGLSLTLFVLLVIWAAVFLYNLVAEFGAVNVIAETMVKVADNLLLRVLLMSWCFVGFLQGIAGFGAPVAAVAPLMIMMGFNPVASVASAMVGHSWAITFGSMGSSYYAIQLVTSLPGEIIGPWMAALFFLPILATGFSVVHLHHGWRGTLRAVPAVLIVGTAMALSMLALNLIGAAQISSMVPSLLGCGLIWLLGRSRLYRPGGVSQEPTADPGEPDNPIEEPHRRSGPGLSFHGAFLPYYVLIVLSILSQLPPVVAVSRDLYFALDYPSTTTGLGYTTAAAQSYARISLFGHPAPLILIAALLSCMVYRLRGQWRRGAVVSALVTTYRRSKTSSQAIAFMVMMALIVNDSGMALLLAQGLQSTTTGFFPVLAPYVGVLGSFITGSNTNSNVMFGPLQFQTAQVMGISVVLISAAQSIGGSLGAGTSPDKAVIGAAVSHLVGREHEIMRRALPYTLVAVLLVGVQVLALLALAPGILP